MSAKWNAFRSEKNNLRHPLGKYTWSLLFIIYINDLPNCLKHTTPRMFADDTSLTAGGKTLNEAEEIANKDLKNVKVWLFSQTNLACLIYD